VLLQENLKTMINFGLLNFKLLELVYIVAFGLSCYTVYTECPALYITLLVAAYICYKVVRSKTADRIDAKKKAVFITGCDTGTDFKLHFLFPIRVLEWQLSFQNDNLITRFKLPTKRAN